MTYTSVDTSGMTPNAVKFAASDLLFASNLDDHETRITASAAAIASGTTGNAALGTRVTALELSGHGWWRAPNSTQTYAFATGNGGNTTAMMSTAVDTPSGLTYSSGVYTVSAGYGGWWSISAEFDLSLTGFGTWAKMVTLVDDNGVAGVQYAAESEYLPTGAGYTAHNASGTVFLSAGDVMRVRVFLYSQANSGTVTNTGPGTGRTHFRAKRLSA